MQQYDILPKKTTEIIVKQTNEFKNKTEKINNVI